MRDMLNRPGFIYMLGIWDPYTACVSEAMGMQSFREAVVQHEGVRGHGIQDDHQPHRAALPGDTDVETSADELPRQRRERLPRQEMIAWRKECETLIGLDEMYKVERDTVEK